MPKFTFISDTHTKHDRFIIHPTDFLIHTGDLTSRGKIGEVGAFLQWFSMQPAKHKIFIAGNHDWFFYNDPSYAKMLVQEYPDVIYLEDSEVILEGFKIYGSPYQPIFYDWAFNASKDLLSAKWELIPSDADIVLTHGPVHGILDYTHYDKEHAGCEILKHHIQNRVKPKIFACGHIHEGYGTYQLDNTLYVNASCLNVKYEAINKPIIVEL